MARCFGNGDDLYSHYHDTEWGVPPAGFGVNEAELFERLSLEVFQVGLSWLLILRRREAFREAFAGFDPAIVAEFDDSVIEGLLANEGIIRNRRKIEATINNAQRLLDMHANGESLAGLFAAHRPSRAVTRRHAYADLPTYIDEAADLSKAMKSRGFTFVGPTNVYAMMQALGIVDDHLVSCPVAEQLDARPTGADVWDEVSERTPTEK